MTIDWGQMVLQLAVVLLGGGTGAGVVNFLLTRPKVRAEAAQIATSTSVDYNEKLYQRLTTENARLGRRQDDLEADLRVEQDRRRILEQYAWRAQSWMVRAYDGIKGLPTSIRFDIEQPPQLKLPERKDNADPR